jgi:hypothetical protein
MEGRMEAKQTHSMQIYSLLCITCDANFKLIVIKSNEETNNYEASIEYSISAADVQQ